MRTIEEIQALVRAHQVRPVGKFLRFAVLYPLVQTDEGLALLYEKRSQKISQPGESSFPGGRMEDGETAKETAIRETVEELGIARSRIEIFGRWNPLITYSNMIIETYVGTIKDFRPARFVPNNEVEEIFAVPLSFFKDTPPSIYQSTLCMEHPDDFPYELLPQERDYPFRTGSHETLFWLWNDRVIWGLTALLTQDFINHI